MTANGGTSAAGADERAATRDRSADNHDRGSGGSGSGSEGAPGAIDERRLARLEALLETLPPGAAARLFAAFEEASASGAKDLPYTAILGVLRARLISAEAAFPERAANARRRFFAPFENFLIAVRRGRKRPARIARSSLLPIWSLINTDPACAEARKAVAALDRALARNDPDAAAETERAMFAAAADGLSKLVSHAENDAAYRADLSERLGGGPAGAAALHDLAEIAFLAQGASALGAVNRLFPGPTAALTEEELFEARRLYAGAYRDNPEIAPYTLLALAGRLASPARALRFYYHLVRVRDAALPAAAEDASFILDTLFEDFESQARALERDAEGPFDPDDATFRIAHLAEFAEAFIAEARAAADGPVVNRAEASRDLAAAALERFCEQALAALRRAQPTRHAGGSSRLAGLRPDIDRSLDRQTVDLAARSALFLTRAGELARRLDRAAPAAAHGAAVMETRRYAGDIVPEIRAAEGDERRAARRLMETTLAIAEPLLTQGELSLLKDRAAAAAVSA